MERGEAWHWTIRLKSAPDAIIGGIELMSEPHNNRGFRIDPAWQRQGLMTEAVEVVADVWFNAPKFEVLRRPRRLRTSHRGESRRRVRARRGNR
jgi:ribosomal-protein-alanine N-acetyltransferase